MVISRYDDTIHRGRRSGLSQRRSDDVAGRRCSLDPASSRARQRQALQEAAPPAPRRPADLRWLDPSRAHGQPMGRRTARLAPNPPPMPASKSGSRRARRRPPGPRCCADTTSRWAWTGPGKPPMGAWSTPRWAKRGCRRGASDRTQSHRPGHMRRQAASLDRWQRRALGNGPRLAPTAPT